MLHTFTKTNFDLVINSNFDVLDFYPTSIYFNGKKLSRLALADFCSIFWRTLQGHSLVIEGIVRLSPELSWSSLKYEDLNCIARVLLFDYCSLNLDYGSYSRIVDAYVDGFPITPLITFVNYDKKIDVDVPVCVCTTYYYNGIEFKSESDLRDYVHTRFPKSKYNVSLKF